MARSTLQWVRADRAHAESCTRMSWVACSVEMAKVSLGKTVVQIFPRKWNYSFIKVDLGHLHTACLRHAYTSAPHYTEKADKARAARSTRMSWVTRRLKVAWTSFEETGVQIFLSKINFSFSKTSCAHLHTPLSSRAPIYSRQYTATQLFDMVLYSTKDLTTHHIQYNIYCQNPAFWSIGQSPFLILQAPMPTPLQFCPGFLFHLLVLLSSRHLLQ